MTDGYRKLNKTEYTDADPHWPVSHAAIRAASRVWGGSRREMAALLARAGIPFSTPAVDSLHTGRVKSARESVLRGIADITMGHDSHYVELIAGIGVHRPTLKAAMVSHVERITAEYQAAMGEL